MRSILLLFLLHFFAFGNSQTPAAIIPKPSILKEKKGTFKLDGNTTIVASEAGENFAKTLRETLRQQTGLDLKILLGDFEELPPSVILIKYNGNYEHAWRDDVLAEGYFLKISPDVLQLDAPLQKSLFWGLQTLRQLIGFQRKSAYDIPCLDITDAPAFDYRGVMLDCGRHFFPIDFLKKQIDLLAFYKINTLRLHLTEDQGWRIEIEKYPELTRRGSWRAEADGSVYGGFYTQDVLRDLVKYAAARNVEIIPEIEMPGHCSAALHAYPNLSCRKKPMPVPTNWGVFQDVFCAGNDSTFVFLEAVLQEVMQIFPSRYIHVGGDEVPKDRWRECSACQRRIKTEGLRDEHELQAYFIRRIQRFLESRGRTLVGWDEILEGGVDSLAVIENWRELDLARQAVRNGNRVILATSNYLYLDRPPGSLTLENVYKFDPLADSFLLANSTKILGLEAPLWSEHITPLNADNMLYPRVLALAESAWTGGGNLDFENFKTRLAQHYPMLDSLGVDYGSEDKNAFKLNLKFSPETNSWTLLGERGLRDLEFRYILDHEDFKKFGATLEIATFSPQYVFQESLKIARPQRFKVQPFRRGRPYAEAIYFNLKNHLAVGKKVVFEPPFDSRYPAAGPMGLTDGILGTTNFNDGAWLGWQGPDVRATLDFDSTIAPKTVSVNFIQQSKSWILLPNLVEFYTSEDGQNWQLAWVNEHKINALDDRSFIEKSEWQVPSDARFRYLRVVAKNPGKLPPGHNGAGGDSWIFTDEILINGR